MKLINADNLLNRMEKICNECEDKGALCSACYFEIAKDMVENEEVVQPCTIQPKPKEVKPQKLNHEWIIGKSV